MKSRPSLGIRTRGVLKLSGQNRLGRGDVAGQFMVERVQTPGARTQERHPGDMDDMDRLSTLVLPIKNP